MIYKSLKKLQKSLQKFNIQQSGVHVLGVLVIAAVAFTGAHLISDSHAATGGTLSVTPASAPQAPGSTFTVAIHENSGTNLINAVQASLTYNAAQLQFVSLTESGSFPTAAATNTATAGLVQVARGTASLTSFSGDKVVASVTFKVLATSGTSASVGLDINKSFIALAADGTNMLSTVTGATYSIQTPVASGNMSLTPATGSFTSGAPVAVALNEDSGTDLVNAVQATVKYDSTKLQFVSITEGTTFTNVAATDTATAGTVRLARGLPASTSVSGAKLVATINFVALPTAASTTTGLTLDTTGSFIARTSDGANILTTTTPANYTITPQVASAPTVTSLSPVTGLTTGGTTVTITGTNYVSGATVTFDTTVVSGTNVTFNSATSLTVTAPAHAAGLVSVIVTNPDGQEVTKANAYTYVAPAPTISAVAPVSGSVGGGTIVTITGTNFVSGASVLVNNVTATAVTFVSATTLTAVTPTQPAGTYAVTVTNPSGQSVTKAASYTYLAGKGDANGDGRVNAIDLSILITHDSQNYPPADFNGDGTVGAADLAILLANWTW